MLIKADTVVDCQWGSRVRKGPKMCWFKFFQKYGLMKRKKGKAEIVLFFWPTLRKKCSIYLPITRRIWYNSKRSEHFLKQYFFHLLLRNSNNIFVVQENTGLKELRVSVHRSNITLEQLKGQLGQIMQKYSGTS